MSEALKIQVGANVEQAVTGINRLNNSLNQTPVRLLSVQKAANSANATLINTGRIIQDMPFGIIGITNNLNPLLESFQRLRAESTSTGAALKAFGASLLGSGGIGLLVSIASSALTIFALRNRESKKDVEENTRAVEEAKKKQEDFKNALDAASSSVLNHASEIDSLRMMYISTSSAVQELTTDIINQGVAAFIFDKKNVEIQRILNAEIQKNLKLRDQAQPFAKVRTILPGTFSKDPLEREKADAQSALIGLNTLGFGLEKYFQRILDKGKRVTEVLKEENQLATSLIQALKVPIELGNPGQRSQESFVRGLTELFKKPITVPLEFDFDPLKTLKLKRITEQIAEIINSSLSNIYTSIGQALGDAITGKTDALRAIVSTIGDLISQIGKALIQYGIVKAGLDKILSAGGIAIPGAIAIALGIAAVAAGQAFKNIPGRASGGPVNRNSPYVVGERGPELFVPNSSGRIIPNHALAGSAINEGFVASHRISGNDLVLLINRTNKYQVRNT